MVMMDEVIGHWMIQPSPLSLEVKSGDLKVPALWSHGWSSWPPAYALG